MDTNGTIVIVDDLPSGREVIRGMLHNQNYDLRFAGSGHELFDLLAEIQPDLILLDIMMPDMDGFDVCQLLKQHQQWQHIPVILVSSLNNKEDLAHGLDLGADDFLSKPVNRLELNARVRSILRIKHQHDMLKAQQNKLEASLHLNQKYSQVFARHLEALEIVHQTSLQLIDNLNMDSVLELISRTVLDLIGEAEGCTLHLLSDDPGQLLPVLFSTAGNGKLVYPALGIEHYVSQSLETRANLCVESVTPNGTHPPPELSNMKALLVTPLFEGESAVGSLSVYSSKTNVFKEEHEHILSIIGHQAAVSINKAKHLRAETARQEREKQTIRNIFQRYVSPAVVDQVVENRNHLALGGKRQDVTILFADIRGFTTFSETLAPEKLIDVLNQYLALAVEAILAESGTLDKFMGDAVMAIFNAPLPQADHPLRAVRAAVAMQQAIAAYNREFGDHPLKFGVGLHLGPAVVGNVGTTQQMNYTAIGDSVNLAKRLQEQAGGNEILLSDALYRALGNNVAVEPVGALSVKGRKAPVQTYRLLDCACD